MKKLTILASTLLSASALATPAPNSSEAVTHAYSESTQGRQTYTYVRCWYRPAQDRNDAATTWEWATHSDGSYYTVDGYWWSSVSHKNMFYTDTPNHEIKQQCLDTLQVDHETADITFYAADRNLSYNHEIWTNDSADAPLNEINRIVAFGDSLSDTGNLFNGSQWVFPNPNSWFLGHFSNGFVWTEYLAKEANVPLHNWAVGGAAGTNQYVAITGIYDQVSSYLTYMDMAENYQPSRTLFTLEFGLNDFMNYNRDVTDVKTDFSSALIRLTDAGAKNIILLTLPDATKAPQFKYSTQEEIEKVRAKIVEFNQFIKQQAMFYQMQGINLVMFDANSLFESLTSNPQQHGFENAADACLNINRSSSLDYLYSHSFSDDCAYHGADKYVFWGVTHPTTAAHEYIAEQIIANDLHRFNFVTK
ncbi:SGNH/GDSL hydrolase family protein [Vibrio intestinalis]|uniref:SGNH/GDSL hydrolase family protein n=1 Tax=Vibrio intestinalis TaxID=2933291 RepID=UPI0021A6BD05|nr:SGNH/GDSL hydrolase family protein [Vibrio intestinalis]